MLQTDVGVFSGEMHDFGFVTQSKIWNSELSQGLGAAPPWDANDGVALLDTKTRPMCSQIHKKIHNFHLSASSQVPWQAHWYRL